MIGMAFGRWTVIGKGEDRYYTTKYPYPFFICQCSCGTIREVNKSSLLRGKSNSCGCLHKEIVTELATTHNGTDTRLYGIWCNMKSRTCHEDNTAAWRDYGGRGIKMCDEWENSFESFESWAKDSGYNDTLTIERINVNGDYEPNNCKWIPPEAQARNKRNTIRITYMGKTFNIHDWSVLVGLPESVIRSRYHTGKTTEEILFAPYGKCEPISVIAIDNNGNETTYESINEAMRETGTSCFTIESALRRENGKGGKYHWKLNVETA